MLSSLRMLAWRVVEHGRRVLIQPNFVPGHHLLTAPGNCWPPQTALQRYLLQQQALTKSISGVTRPRGQGGGSSSNNGCSNAAVPASPLVSLLGRIRPLVSDAVRRLSSASSRRLGGNRNSLYRDTAPLFALVGVTLVGYEREEDDCISAAAVNTRKQKGFLTREEELEAICGSIREAVFKSGWLYDDRHQYFGNETKNGLDSQQQTNIQLNSSHNQNVNATNTTATTTTEEFGNNTTNGNYHANDCENVTNNNDLQSEGSLSNNQNSPCNNTKDNNHVYSLQDLDLSGVIDKGCNAVVYAARWKNSELEENSSIPSSNTTRLDATGINNSAEQIILHKINETHSTDDSSINSTSDTSLNSTANQNYRSNTAANLNETTNRSLNSNAYANSDLDLNINYNFKESSNNTSSTFDSNINSNFLSSLNLSGIEPPPTNLDDLSCNPRQSLLSVLPLHGSTVSLLTQPSFEEASSGFCGTRQSLLDQEQSYNLAMPDDNFAGRSDLNYGGIWNTRRCSNSLSEDVGRLLSSGGFGTPLHHKPHNKRVRFLTPSNNAARSSGMRHDSIDETMPTGQENDNLETNVMTDNRNASSSDGGHLPPSSAYPLAVKLVFNYEAASNAPAILSALYRELIPARSVQLDALYSSWRNDFFGDASHQLLPYHPNIVDMQCAFVDRVPLLQGGMQLYPTALPPRLNPDGFGRNMSLFCVMRRYDVSLDSYLTQYPNPSARTSLLMMTQLLEALQHLHHHNICHRDLKPDNILLSLREGPETPWLVLTDFGCCLAATSKRGLSVPFISREAEPRQGNAALMAPEVKTARPGLLQFVNFSSCDIWAAGALSYQFYGFPNPFLKSNKSGIALDSGTYKESQLPGLLKSSAPASVRRLVADLLRRKPGNRPSPTVAATLCQLSLWGPSAWLNRHSLVKPKHQEVMEWLLCLTTKVLCERRGSSTGETEYRLVSTFLSRVRYTDVLQAIAWNRAF